VQGWELEFFPPRVRSDLLAGLLNQAGETMNQSRSSERLYVCDMSVMPFSSAANPVRTLVALALRLAQKLG